MKKAFSILLIIFAYSLCTNAQVMVDEFDTNQYGWTETTQRGGTAIIKDGVMRLEAKSSSSVYATCYAPFDFNKPFSLSVDVLADKINTMPEFGLLFDFEDDQNYLEFVMYRDRAVLRRKVADQVVATKQEDLKLEKGKNIGLQIEVEYTLNELLFRINGVKALSYRRRVPYNEFLLGTSGIGFIAGYGQKVSFDNLKIEQ